MTDTEAFDRVRTFLRSRGVSDREAAAALDEGVLHLLVADCVVMPEPGRYTAAEMAGLSGLNPDILERLWRAMGFADPTAEERTFTDSDLEALTIVREFLDNGRSSEDDIVQLTRVVGSSMARIAEAEVTSNSAVFGPTIASGDTLAAADYLVTTAVASMTTLSHLLEHVWRRHLQAALRRAAVVMAGDIDGDAVPDPNVQLLTVGFADLVGYTAQAQHLSEAALSELVGRFTALAHDTVAEGGGRVVKTIGDEVMFVVPDVGAGVTLALTLAHAYARDDFLSDVRVGLAYGPVLHKDGDYYGPTVNLAHRISTMARPGTVVVGPSVRSELEDDHRFLWRAIGSRYLKDIGRVSLSVPRFNDPESEGIAERARRLGEHRLRLLFVDRKGSREGQHIPDGETHPR